MNPKYYKPIGSAVFFVAWTILYFICKHLTPTQIFWIGTVIVLIVGWFFVKANPRTANEVADDINKVKGKI